MSRMRCGTPPNALVDVQKSVVIELDERLKGDTQALAVIEDRAMVIRNPPWAGIEIEALLEFTGLLEAPEFSE